MAQTTVIFNRGLVLATILLAFNSASAQDSSLRNTASLSIGRGMLSAFGHEYAVGELEFSRRVVGPASATAALSFSYRDVRNQEDLLSNENDSNWSLRKHVRLTAGVTIPLLGLRVGAVQNRLAVASAIALRHVDDQIFSGSFYPAYFAGSPPGTENEIREAFEEAGIIVIMFEHDDGEGGQQDGLYLSYARQINEARLGAEVGFRLESRYQNVVGGIELSAARYLNQKLITGSHSAELSVRVGYRF